LIVACNGLLSFSQKIDRKALVTRHNVIVTKADSLSSLTVGNGRFAFTVDVTGLQTFPEQYAKGVPLGTQSEWGWHSFIDTVGYKREEAYKNYHVNGRDIPYTVQWNSPDRNKNAANWFRQNPHRLQLANIGFELIKKDGSLATLEDIKDVKQDLNLWTGEIKSSFSLEGESVIVSTVCSSDSDIISFHVQSRLLAVNRLLVRIRFPYPTGQWTDEGSNFVNDNDHHSRSIIPSSPETAVFLHEIQKTSTYVTCTTDKLATIREKKKHYFLLSAPRGATSFWMSIGISEQPDHRLPAYSIIKQRKHTGLAKILEQRWRYRFFRKH
jgi:protein-glucosylgalactosylhydroxylysine glucosidase